jgi:hypothetical protein
MQAAVPHQQDEVQLPWALALFAAVNDFKQHPTSIGDAISTFNRGFANRSVFDRGVFAFASTLIAAFTTCLLGVFAESVSQWYGNDRFKCYSAVAASSFLALLFVVILVLPLRFIVMYSFIGN